jgi:hypothetical protein
MGVKTGMEAKLYYKAGGVAGQGDWLELTNIKDNTLNLEKGEADVTTRGNNGWKATVGTLKSGSVEFEMVWDPEDAGFAAISAAYFEGTVIGLAILDGAKETGTGLVADFAITNFSRKEPLEEAVSVSVTAKPTYSATAPIWMEAGQPPLGGA